MKIPEYFRKEISPKFAPDSKEELRFIPLIKYERTSSNCEGRRRRPFARIVVFASTITTLALAPCAHAINAYWLGGSSDDWDGFHWDVGGSGLATSLVNSNDESIYDLYFGSRGHSDINGIVTTTNSVSPSSLNFSQQNWTLNVGAIASGATSASPVHLNVNHTSPTVTINSTYGISFGTPLSSSYMDMNVDTGSVLTLNASVYGRGSLNKYGDGTVVINSGGRPGVVSGTNVFGGTLITDSPYNDYNVRAGATANFNIPDYYGDFTYTGNIYGAGNFVKTGGGTLTMTTDVYYTGSTTVEGGRLVLATFHNPYVTSGFTFNGGDLELSTRTSNMTYANTIQGSHSFTKSGSMNLTLTGRDNHAGGGVFVTGGNLTENIPMGDSYTLSSGGSLTFNANGAEGVYFSGRITGAGAFVKTGSGSFYLTGDNTYTGGTSVNGGSLFDYNPHGDYALAPSTTLYFPVNDNRTYAGSISGSIIGSGDVVLLGSGTLTRTGSPVLWSGTTHIYNDGRLIDLHPQGNYRLEGFDGASGNLEFANSGPVFFGDPSFPYPGSVGGSISGPGNFTKSGAGDLIFTRNMTYEGQTTINGGNLVALVSNALPTSTDLTVNAGGSFVASGGKLQTIGSLAGGGLVTLSGNTLTINGSTNATFSGVISETAGSSVVKGGAGTQTFTGVNTYTGGTFVNDGRLIDAHPHGSYTLSNFGELEFPNAGNISGLAVRTANNVVLNTSGDVVTIGRALTYNAGQIYTSDGGTTAFTGGVYGSGNFTGHGTVSFTGAYSPGDGSSPAASVTFEGNLVLHSTDGLLMGLGSFASDHITVYGAANLGGILNISWLAGDSISVTRGESFDLFDFRGSSHGMFSSISLPVLPSDLRWDISTLYSTGEISVMTAVPEPNTLATLCLGTGIVLLVNRRRRRTSR
ncbi:MAG: autotransporter-associated beta strand repeat-containing protein [Gammaproteobacteria bacterium]|nr:MAG: autotransporter-associated beta strand repeat-containing protein [Gammaproteobacteria bacterium]